jgi:hypothetical protein
MKEISYEGIKKENVLSNLNHINTIGFIKDGRGQRLQSVSYKVGLGIPTSYKLQGLYEETMNDLEELKYWDNYTEEKLSKDKFYRSIKFLRN